MACFSRSSVSTIGSPWRMELEIRMPFMDWRLVCYAFSYQMRAKWEEVLLSGSCARPCAECCRKRCERSKLGFVSPIESWLNGELGDWAWDRVNTKAFLESEIWNGPAIRNFIALRQTAKNWNRRDALCVWMYLQADL